MPLTHRACPCGTAYCATDKHSSTNPAALDCIPCGYLAGHSYCVDCGRVLP